MKIRFALSLVLCSLCSVALAADWPQFQGPDRLGVSPETGLNLTDWGEEGPPILWEKTLNEGFGGAAIQGDEVFLIDRDLGERDHLLCLSLIDGSEQWRYTFDYPGKLSFPGSRGVPLVEEDAVYYTSGFGQIFRISRETRDLDWMISIQDEYGAEVPKWGWAQSPVLVGDILVAAVMSDDVGLIGLDKNTGKELWRTEAFGGSFSTPTVLELQGVEQVVFGASVTEEDSEVGTTISVAPDTGEVLWKTDIYYNKYPIPFPTKVAEDLVFLTGGYEDGSCMIKVRKDGTDWSVDKVFDFELGTQIHPPFVIDDHIYLLANENANHKGEARKTGGLMCLDLEGNIVWNTGDEPFMGRGNMIYADGHLLIQDGEVGYLRAVKPSPEGYEEVAIADVFGKKEEVDEQIAKQSGRDVIKVPDFKYWTPMALSEGRLIMRGQDQLKCVDLR
ncbi:MAG: PQQ-binding-like beta-propeller repeat protein [Verrucomicrobiota bacterium]